MEKRDCERIILTYKRCIVITNFFSFHAARGWNQGCVIKAFEPFYEIKGYFTGYILIYVERQKLV